MNDTDRKCGIDTNEDDHGVSLKFNYNYEGTVVSFSPLV
jgi:hypothetical protein